MVRVGDWEMRLVRTGTGEPYPEVQQQGGAGTTFAVAAPGQGFEVQVIQRPSRYATTASTHIVSHGSKRVALQHGTCMCMARHDLASPCLPTRTPRPAYR